jgi:hypothetical protein
MRVVRLAAIAATVCFVAVSSLAASDRKTLPAFTLDAVDGSGIESRSLAVDETWLFVYVQADCPPCDALLARIDSAPRPSVSRIVIVAAGMDAAQAGALAAKYANLRESRWLADPRAGAAVPLGVRTLPTVLGLRGSSIEWRLTGIVRDARELDSILFTWLEER